ncbi:MAG: ATP-binding protein [Saprospiraceae bacterium]|nr:ATP-binding protein [Saprospiraceae bacterium]
MNIKTNKANHVVVKTLTTKFGFPNESIAAKIAINYTLQLNKIFDAGEAKDYDNTGKEYDENTLFGGRDNYVLYRALFNQQYGRLLGEDEFYRLVKLHLDWGLERLREEILESDRGRNAHVDYLLSIVRRGINLVADEKSLSFTAPLPSTDNLPSHPGLVDFDLGQRLDGSTVNIRLNDLKEFESHHIAIAGTTGSGKTELIKDILFQMTEKTGGRLKFIFFDYKGEGQSNKLLPFLEKTQCGYVNPLHDAFQFNPLSFINIANEKVQHFHINSFADAVAAIEPKIGPKQKNLLKTIVSNCVDAQKKLGRYPALTDVFAELKNMYEELKEKPDTLYAIMQDLASGVFAEEAAVGRQPKIYESSLYVSLPEAMSEKLRQLCVFLTLKYLLSEFTSMNDVEQSPERILPLRYVIVVDEAHVYLNNKNARTILEQLLRVIRSKGVVVVMLSQGVEDYYKSDFDFASQVKLPICLYIKNKNYKAVERFVGTAKSSHKLEKALEGLDKGMGILNYSEPILLRVRQFWERI